MTVEAGRRPLPGDFRIIPTRVGEVGIILGLIKELATYERAAESGEGDRRVSHPNPFWAFPQAEVLVAWENTEAVGFALAARSR